MTQLAIHITSNQYTSHHRLCRLLLPVSNVSKRKSYHHKALLCAYWRRSPACPSQMNHHVSPCQWSGSMNACVRSRVNAFLLYRVRGHLECALMCACVWRACVRSSSYDTACVAHLRALSLVCACGVRACVWCRIRGCLACALTYVRKRLACIRGRRRTCASRAVYLSCELFPTFRLFRAATLI